MCDDEKRYSTSGPSSGEAFQADRILADDMQAQNRSSADCAAVLAGYGRGEDAPPPSEEASTRLRQRALEWLKANLAH